MTGATSLPPANEHLTGLRRFRGKIIAQCPEHGAIGHIHADTTHGLNAVRDEARAHDHIAHGVYRTAGGWTVAFARQWTP